MRIRTAVPEDAEELAAIEKLCFPSAEAASPEQLAARMDVYSDHFLVLQEENGRIVSFVDGLCTDQRNLTDEMYERPEMHREDGAWQMIFGVNTIPECRSKGYASKLLQRFTALAAAQGRNGLVLTCKAALLPFYARLGFKDEGMSASVHGGVPWHQMRLILCDTRQEDNR